MSDSYGLDIIAGFDGIGREKLVAFLQETGRPFDISKAQRGIWYGRAILRVWTPKAEELQRHIIAGMENGNCNEYEIYASYDDMQRTKNWWPDTGATWGCEEFDLFAQPAQAAQ